MGEAVGVVGNWRVQSFVQEAAVVVVVVGLLPQRGPRQLCEVLVASERTRPVPGVG